MTPLPRPPNADFFDLREIALFRPGGDVEWKRAWSARVEQAGLRMSLTTDGKYWGVAASDYPDRPFSTWVIVGDARDGRVLWQTPDTRAPGLHVQFSILGAAEAVIVSPVEGGCTGFYGKDGAVVLLPGPSGQENSAGDRVYVLAGVEPEGSCLLVCYDIYGQPLWRMRDARPRATAPGGLGGFALSPSGEWLADLGVDPAAIYRAR
ncbi:MAG TPA: hypothetical protein PLD23_00890 [Armatimonadota bacterium]|nr:hypothetical protein [Armatimonadota bacterium]